MNQCYDTVPNRVVLNFDCLYSITKTNLRHDHIVRGFEVMAFVIIGNLNTPMNHFDIERF